MNCDTLDPTAILFKKAVGRRPVALLLLNVCMLHLNGVRHTARTIELMMFERRIRCRVLEFPIANPADG